LNRSPTLERIKAQLARHDDLTGGASAYIPPIDRVIADGADDADDDFRMVRQFVHAVSARMEDVE